MPGYNESNIWVGPIPPAPASPGGIWIDTTSSRIATFSNGQWGYDVEVFDVMLFGAKGDGVTDDTQAIQNALNAANNANGGFGAAVFLPPTANGYLCNGTLNVPAYVTLYGNSPYSPAIGGYIRLSGLAQQTWKASTLLSTANSGSTDPTKSFINLYRGSTIAGIQIFYPNQTPTNPPIQYPPAINFFSDNTSPVHHFGASVVNCLLVNPYIGINVVNHEKPFINGLYGQPLNTGIQMDQVFDIARIENVHFWNFWSSLGVNPNLDTYIQTNGVAFHFQRVDGVFGVNLFCYGYNTGFWLDSSSNGSGTGEFTNVWVDGMQRGIVHSESEYPWIFNGFTCFITSGGTTAARGILVNGGTGTNNGALQIRGGFISAPGGICVEILSTAHLPVQMSQVRFSSWSTSAGMAAIKQSSTDGDLQVSDCTFVQTTGKDLDISNISSSATGLLTLDTSKFKNGFRVNAAGTNPQITGLSTSGTATITAGQTSTTVSHGMGLLPIRVRATPTADTLGARWWVNTYTQSQFTITINTTVASNITFDWQAQAYEG